MKIIITASEGMWLTDGESYGKTISLANSVSIENYYEITEEEYEKLQNNLIEGEYE